MTNSPYYVSLDSTMDMYLCLSRRGPGSKSRRFMEDVCSIAHIFGVFCLNFWRGSRAREARVGQSPILIDYGQPLFVWLSRD